MIDDLQAQVTALYAGRDLPAWPSPRAFDEEPREEEYSRVTDPGRYRIVSERGRVWTEVLSTLPGVTATTLAPAPLDRERHFGNFDRGVQLTSERPGALPLLLLERDAQITDAAEPARIAVLHLAVAEPTVELAFHPDCGCDACDSGSEYLLEAIDEPIRKVVGGPFVALQGPTWSAQWHPGGGSSSGSGRGPDHERMLDLCRRLAAGEDVRLPRKTRAFVGRSWLG